MAQFRQVRKKPEIEVERLDGGLNKKDGPSKIDITESPECLNVEYGDRGSVGTREGTSYFNTQTIGSAAGDGSVVYKQTMVVFAGGSLHRVSGTTAVTVPAASGAFTSGRRVAYQAYQDILFCSDGVNGPYRYEGGTDFYNMGIAEPVAVTATSDTSGGGGIAADTYYYAVTYINSHAVEGAIGSASAGVTLAASASVDVSSIPVGSGLEGVAERNLYRATSASGPWLFVQNIADNVTTSVSDNVGVGAEGGEPPDDATSPKPFNAIREHQNRLWMPDSDNETLLRYTEFDNPFVSKNLNFLLLSKGDGSDIKAIGVQNNLVTAFKDNSIFVINIPDPSDDTTFQTIKSPANAGIVGPRAFVEEENGIIFMAKRSGHIIGVGYISGVGLIDTQDQFLVSRTISKKIEPDILAYPGSLWDDVAMVSFKNRIYMGVPASTSSTRIDGVLQFDINRLVYDQNTDPGSWSPWSGVVGVNDWVVFGNELYGVSSASDGYILKFNNGTYTDADGSAIDSYWYSKEIGGEPGIESWVKDFRFVVTWLELLGSYNMDLVTRVDGDQGSGTTYQIDITPGGSLWNNAAGSIVGGLVWNNGNWGPGLTRKEVQTPVGPSLGKRLQIGFSNQNTAGQGFKVHSFKIRMNLRRQR